MEWTGIDGLRGGIMGKCITYTGSPSFDSEEDGLEKERLKAAGPASNSGMERLK